MPIATDAKKASILVAFIGPAHNVLHGDTATNVPWKANVEVD